MYTYEHHTYTGEKLRLKGCKTMETDTLFCVSEKETVYRDAKRKKYHNKMEEKYLVNGYLPNYTNMCHWYKIYP